MQLRRRHRLPRRDRLPLPVPDRPLRRWSLIRPTLLGASVPQPQHRRRLQPGISRSVDLSISGERLARFLNDLAKLRPLPESLVIDNGPELTSKAIFEWAQANRVPLHFSEPGKPTQNAFVAGFNGRFRNESLNQEWFVNLAPARAIIEAWRVHYNTTRPHSALGYQTPAA